MSCSFWVCSHLHLLVLLGAAVVLCWISGRCERVSAGNINPTFWGCQGLDKSCLNFTLCKMPCVNRSPWPKHSDLAGQTPGVARPPILPPTHLPTHHSIYKSIHPSLWGHGWQSVKVQFCSQSGLKYSRMNKQANHFGWGANGKNGRKKSSDGSTSCSLLPCLGQLALVVESLRQVLCQLWVAEATSASSTSAALLITENFSNSLWVSWQIIWNTAKLYCTRSFAIMS